MSKTSVITNRGVSIVRSAANRHDECVFVDAVSSTHFENTPNELATKPDYWWDGVKGEIVAVQSGMYSLICDFCSSGRGFASIFFQIPPRSGHP